MDKKHLESRAQLRMRVDEYPSIVEPSGLTKTLDAIAHMGMGEIFVRIGTDVLTLLLVLGVAALMQRLYGRNYMNQGGSAAQENAQSLVAAPILLPPIDSIPEVSGISRKAILHTTIPNRPRVVVIEYTVQPGDTVFGIADKFDLKPSTILFGNYETLRDTPHSLRPDQKLNILPVDGTYYQWQGTENLTKVAEYFDVDVDAIINFPGNHLDQDTIGDLDAPNIASGTWLVIPGGTRAFSSWSAPIGITRSSPATTVVLGPGACGPVSGGNVGFGTFVYPTVEHWLSGTPFRPDVGHPALDFAGSLNNAIYATDAGVVVYAGWNTWGYGNLVVIDHGNGWQSLYAHLNVINVGCGQSVGQGDIIALMGSTGNSTGPHLHFELMNTNYGKVNPFDYLP